MLDKFFLPEANPAFHKKRRLWAMMPDENRNNWIQAIRKDKLTWTHVSDLKYFENEVAKLYHINSIPANFLIDPSGKIIARNLRGEELSQTLANILR